MPSLLPFFEHHPNRARNAPRFRIRLESSQPDSFCGKLPLHSCESPTDRFEMTRRTTYPTASQVRCRSRRPILLMHRQSAMNGYCNLHQKLHSGLLNESCNGCSRHNFPITGSEKKVQGLRSLILALRKCLKGPWMARTGQAAFQTERGCEIHLVVPVRVFGIWKAGFRPLMQGFRTQGTCIHGKPA